jgi:hypothetical protein
MRRIRHCTETKHIGDLRLNCKGRMDSLMFENLIAPDAPAEFGYLIGRAGDAIDDRRSETVSAVFYEPEKFSDFHIGTNVEMRLVEPAKEVEMLATVRILEMYLFHVFIFNAANLVNLGLR